ncbi:MAG TPA: hypothetical protein PLU80_04860, partial [Acidobacteriota bacterium]|nr:hypothetical protein [Acidobacteriota bacterium]
MTLTDLQADIYQALGERAIPVIYREKILTERTRQFVLFPPDTPHVTPEKVHIHYTLLGIELKLGTRRLSCPDLGTARFLQVFGRLGVGI